MCFFPFSLALSIKSALFASALVLALFGLGLFLAKVALYTQAEAWLLLGRAAHTALPIP